MRIASRPVVLLSKIALAAASGFCTWIVWASVRDVGPQLLAFYGLPGLLFAAGVLFPYLRRDRFFWYRCIGLIVVSAISYYSAITLSGEVGHGGDFGPAPQGFLAASLLGATIALIGARLLIPLRRSVELVVMGLAAAVIGGFGFVLAFRDWPYLAFMLWHSLVALAIYGSENWPLPIAKAK